MILQTWPCLLIQQIIIASFFIYIAFYGYGPLFNKMELPKNKDVPLDDSYFLYKKYCFAGELNIPVYMY